ncbi:MAG: hypothetical protein OHK0039_08180 [Bacteroidia bacterium]
MPPFLQRHLPELQALCQQHAVAYLYAVGSVLRSADFGPESDVDFLFAFHEAAIDNEGYNRNLWSFWQRLEQLLGRKVDLIHEPSLKNPFLIEELQATRKLVYESEGTEVPVGPAASVRSKPICRAYQTWRRSIPAFWSGTLSSGG